MTDTQETIATKLAESFSDDELESMLDYSYEEWFNIVKVAKEIKEGDADTPDSFAGHQYHDIG